MKKGGLEVRLHISSQLINFKIGGQDSYTTFDFQAGSGDPVVDGDTVGTRWTAFPLSDIGKLDAPAASNADAKQAQRFTLGTGAVSVVCSS
jgi:hypothetical protein